MSGKVIVSREKLVAVADAIRVKTESADGLTLDEMPGVIAGIETGGGDALGDLLEGTLTTYENSTISSVSLTIFRDYTVLESCKMSLVRSLPDYMFSNATALKKVDILGGGTLASRCMEGCSGVETIILREPETETQTEFFPLPCFVGEANVTRNFTRAQWNTFGTVGRSERWTGLNMRLKDSITYMTGTVKNENSKPVWLFGLYTEDYGSRLQTLAFVETEEEANALMAEYRQQFAHQYIYVPSALVESYKVATGWSEQSEKIRAIEDYPDICGG